MIDKILYVLALIVGLAAGIGILVSIVRFINSLGIKLLTKKPNAGKIPWFIPTNNIPDYINSTLDNQLDNIEEVKFLKSLDSINEDIIPSCMTFEDWLCKELELSEDKVVKFRERYYDEYCINYRKELREWWFNRKLKNKDYGKNNKD